MSPEIFLRNWKERRDSADELSEEFNHILMEQEKNRSRTTKKRKRSPFRQSERVLMHVIDRASGLPRPSVWWINYVLFPELMTRRMHDKFRLRFRMPFSAWSDLVVDMKESPIFESWHDGKTNCAGKKSSPLELLSLGALRYLGRKCTFDCLEDVTFIGEKTHSRFFKAFIEYGSTVLYDRYVVSPTTAEDAVRHMHEMTIAGLSGAIGSMDATHVIVENCRYGLRISHKSHKLNKAARSYNIVANHRRRILSSTRGHPCSWNDKSIVLFDRFVEKIRSGEALEDVEFELLEYGPGNEIHRVTYRGVWILVDNGYHPWSITIPPFNYVGNRKELRWSQWMESMRKDVECTFGILKKRWTVLSKGIQATNIITADKVWRTCCALHNYLLDIDGLDEIWQDNVTCSDSGYDCFAIRRLTGCDDGDERDEIVQRNITIHEGQNFLDQFPVLPGEVRDVRGLTFDCMRSKLVDHFDITFSLGNVVWPKRVKKPRNTI